MFDPQIVRKRRRRLTGIDEIMLSLTAKGLTTGEIAAKWDGQYPAIVRLWENSWTEITPFPDYDMEIRRVICSTNAIESRAPATGVRSGLGDTSPASRRH